MMLVKAITLHMGITMLLAAMITLSDLSLGGKNVLFRLGGSPLCSLFHYFHFLKAMGRTVGLSPASVTVRCTQCFQLKKKKKKINLQVRRPDAKENHCKGKVCSKWVSAQLLIIPSGSRISSSSNKDKSGPSKRRFPDFYMVWGTPVEGEETLHNGTWPLATVLSDICCISRGTLATSVPTVC